MRIDDLKATIDDGATAKLHMEPGPGNVELDICIYRLNGMYVHEFRYPIEKALEPQQSLFRKWESLLNRLRSKRENEDWTLVQRAKK